MDKVPFLHTLHDAWAAWQAELAAFPGRAAAAAGWSEAELIDHVTWYEREMLEMLQAHAFVGSPHWTLPNPERNAIIRAEAAGRPLATAEESSFAVHDALVAALSALPESAWHDPAAFPGMPDDRDPAAILAENTFDHYRQHMPPEA